MLMRKTQYAWMSLGGLICLFGLMLACKLHDGNRAIAQPEPPPASAPVKKDSSPTIFSLPPTLQTKEPELLPPPKKTEKSKEPARPDKPSEARPDKPSKPKATLEMPSPSEPPVLLPASFGPNTPTPPETKKTPDTPPPPRSAPTAPPSSSIKSSSINFSSPLSPTPATPALEKRVEMEDRRAEPVKPLPLLRTKPPTPRAKVLPFLGTYPCRLDEKGRLTLPQAIRDQLGGSDIVLLSPGPDKCLWLTNQPHLECLSERLDQSQANEADVRVFKRLYFAQTEKRTIDSDGRVAIPERLGQFAGLHQDVVLVGIDDHFEVWDTARWRAYTQEKSVGRSE
jgi:MraZ protein